MWGGGENGNRNGEKERLNWNQLVFLNNTVGTLPVHPCSISNQCKPHTCTVEYKLIHTYARMHACVRMYGHTVPPPYTASCYMRVRTYVGVEESVNSFDRHAPSSWQ